MGCGNDVQEHNPRESLDSIEQCLTPVSWGVGAESKFWFWKDNVLVLEITQSDGARYAFDFVVAEGFLELKVVGRDDATRYRINKRLWRITSLIKGQPHRFLGRWKLSTYESSQACVEIGALIQRAATLMAPATDIPIRSVPGYWWDLQENFGDQVGAWIIEMITGRPAHNTMGDPAAGYGLVTVGSILTGMYRPGLSVWGTGIIARPNRATLSRLSKNPPTAIHALRGELTRSVVEDELQWEPPAVLGDPALVLPLLFEPPTMAHEGDPKNTLVPHYAHKRALASHQLNASWQAINVRNPPEVVVSQIATSRVVVSTSLHGLIVAQAYGVPWVWLNIIDSQLVGSNFKFDDFFSTLQKAQVSRVDVNSDQIRDISLDDVAAKATLPESKYDPRALLNAFPESELVLPLESAGFMKQS